MNEPTTRRTTASDRVRLSAADRETLRLLARLPLLWAQALAQLTGHARPTSTYRRLKRLHTAGLVAALRPPQVGGPGPRLYYPTKCGLAALGGQAADAPARLGRLGRGDLAELLPGLPPRLAAYRLVAGLAASRPGRPELLAWEQPWRRRYHSPAGRAPIRVELPAYAAIRWDGGPVETFLLIPDLGALPLRVYRGTLGRLLVLRSASGPWPPLVIAVPSERRGTAWVRFLAELAQLQGEAPLTARIVIWADLAAGPACQFPDEATAPAGSARREGRESPGSLSRSDQPPHRLTGTPAKLPTGSPARRATGTRTDPPSPAPILRSRALLELVGRQAFLRTRDLGRAFGWTLAWTRRRRNRLISRGLLRLVGEQIGEPPAEWELVELTAAGASFVAAQQGLTRAAAVRHTGLLGSGLRAPAGARAALLRHIEHTVGVHDIFIRLIEAARAGFAGGRDDALVEWRNAAACARQRVRPDGYGVLRHRGDLYGFFLEYDRGTESRRDYRNKLGAYYDYRDSRAFERDYDGFPTILFVTTGPGPERRISEIARAAGVGREPPLPVLITTLTRAAGSPAGLLGPIWREPASPVRRPWPGVARPGESGRSAAEPR